MEYWDRVCKVHDLLKEKPRTARDIMRAMKCSKPTAYSLLEDVLKYSTLFSVTKKRVRQSARGPRSVFYGCQ